jgi:Arc/MetJ family transcription regulator
MRTNIDIDDKLMKEAMKATGLTTKKAAVEAAMQLAVRLHKQGEALKGLWGIGWEGDLNEMRRSKHLDWDRNLKSGAKSRRKKAA